MKRISKAQSHLDFIKNNQHRNDDRIRLSAYVVEKELKALTEALKNLLDCPDLNHDNLEDSIIEAIHNAHKTLGE